MPEIIKPIIAIAGATASGKTDLSFKLCDNFPTEIISVDSALIYKGMDIGTAKPTKDELAQYRHHLIDILDPSESYSAASFITDATNAIKDIKAHSKIPLLVGGTMLYFKALIEGLSTLPAANVKIRAALTATAEVDGWPLLHEKLMKLDPITGSNIKPNDAQRIQRALEVIAITNKPMSSLLGENLKKGNFKQPIELIALVPSDRAMLHTQIKQRFMLMLENGFLDEVETLMQNPEIHEGMPSIRCVGYRQAWQYLQNKYDYNTFVEKSLVATRQLAKRQLTWIRNWKGNIKVFDSVDKSSVEKLKTYLYNKLA